MATLRDIRRRIRSVESTQKITRAMKFVAAAKFRRAQERVLAARPYASKMAELLGHLVSGTDAAEGTVHPLLEERQGPRRQICIITADKGLAGAFNANVIRNALDLIRTSNATANAKEMISVLTIQYNKARQERITKELLDIVGGAEALKQGAEA
jgi:F-type H+-transporting ATPase subunit gamma